MQLDNETIKEFVIAGHGNFEKVKAMLLENPELLNTAFEWREGDFETALQAASHVGNDAIARFLLSQGAKLEITTAAMLGDVEGVEIFLTQNPDLIQAKGAHGITLLTHAVMSEKADLVRSLILKGATEGSSMALNIATDIGNFEVVKVLLEHTKPDVTWRNFKGKSALELANPEILALLEAARHA
ncbi:MAG: hypothetical protein RLZZ156_1395 [Deinococcota bacterium]|jgi:uncharacterized protein